MVRRKQNTCVCPNRRDERIRVAIREILKVDGIFNKQRRFNEILTGWLLTDSEASEILDILQKAGVSVSFDRYIDRKAKRMAIVKESRGLKDFPVNVPMNHGIKIMGVRREDLDVLIPIFEKAHTVPIILENIHLFVPKPKMSDDRWQRFIIEEIFRKTGKIAKPHMLPTAIYNALGRAQGVLR